MTQMSQEDAARIQSTQAREGQDTSAGSFPARAQSAADRHANEEAQAMGHGSGSDEGGRSDGGGGSDSGGGGRRGGRRGRRGRRGGGGGGGAGVLNSMVPDVGGGVMVITKEEASHIKSVEMREGFDTGRGSLAARAQAAADRYEAAHHSGGGGGGGGGGRRGGRGGGGQGGVGNVDFPHMTKEEASLIQSIEAREGHDTGHGTLSALAQSAADRHANEGQRENI